VPLFSFTAKLFTVSEESDAQLAFCNVSKGGSFYRAKRHIREDLILPELLSYNLSDVPEDIFLEKLRFYERNKNCVMRKEQ
jgi:hypothetical protein